MVEGLRRVRHALKPGGWLLLPGSTIERGADSDMARGKCTSLAAPCSRTTNES